MHRYKLTELDTTLEHAEKALILLHGRGAPPEDILSLADFFDLDGFYVVAPEATNYTWYPKSFLAPVEENQPWLDSALGNLEKLIHEIEKHIPAENIFIMGFSQGACLTAEVTARNAKAYGGIGVFTGGLIGAEPDFNKYKGSFAGTKAYISNGDNDPHIPLARTEETIELFGNMGADVTREIFPGRPHTINMDEINKAKDLFNL